LKKIKIYQKKVQLIKGHGAYDGCFACSIHGEYSGKSICYPQTFRANWPLRTQDNLIQYGQTVG